MNIDYNFANHSTKELVELVREIQNELATRKGFAYTTIPGFLHGSSADEDITANVKLILETQGFGKLHAVKYVCDVKQDGLRAAKEYVDNIH